MAVLTYLTKSTRAPACPKLSLAEQKKSCISVLLPQNLLCIVILNLPTLNNKRIMNVDTRESALQVQVLSAWPHRVDTYKNSTTSKNVRTKVMNNSILVNWNIPQVIKPEVTLKWNQHLNKSGERHKPGSSTCSYVGSHFLQLTQKATLARHKSTALLRALKHSKSRALNLSKL